jgi:hypothetical protein
MLLLTVLVTPVLGGLVIQDPVGAFTLVQAVARTPVLAAVPILVRAVGSIPDQAVARTPVRAAVRIPVLVVARTPVLAAVPILVLVVVPTVVQEGRATPGLAEDRMTNGTAPRLTVGDACTAAAFSCRNW